MDNIKVQTSYPIGNDCKIVVTNLDTGQTAQSIIFRVHSTTNMFRESGRYNTDNEYVSEVQNIVYRVLRRLVNDVTPMASEEIRNAVRSTAKSMHNVEFDEHTI